MKKRTESEHRQIKSICQLVFDIRVIRDLHDIHLYFVLPYAQTTADQRYRLILE